MDRSDGFKYDCRGGQAVKRYRVEQSIRHGSWFEKSNLTLQEIMKITYYVLRIGVQIFSRAK